jgi:hypothetical protein
VEADIRRRDVERLELQRAEGIDAGAHLLHRRPDEPLLSIGQTGVALNPEAQAALEERASRTAKKRRDRARSRKKAD